MLKKLDKLILKAFAGPFLLTFAVVQFILLTHPHCPIACAAALDPHYAARAD